MTFKLFFAVSIVNVFIIVLMAIFGLVKGWLVLDEDTIASAKFVLLGLAFAAAGLWSFLMCFVKCPHCRKQALLFKVGQKKVQVLKPKTPLLLRPFAVLVDHEYFAGYCHCKSCNEKIKFQ